MRYLLAAAITLLVFIMEDGDDAEVHQDLVALEDLAAYVTRLVEVESCDLQNALGGIRQILNVAMAVSRGQYSVSSPEVRTSPGLLHRSKLAYTLLHRL